MITVKGLGGVCYTFSDKPSQQEEEDEAGIDDHDAEEEEDVVAEYGKCIYKFVYFRNIAHKILCVHRDTLILFIFQ